MKIYTTVEPVPSRILALARLSMTVGPLAEDELIPLLQPRDNTGIATSTLNAALECGLLLREKGKCKIAPGLFDSDLRPSGLDSVLPVVLSRLLLAESIAGEPNKFAILCAWMLHQNPTSMPNDRGSLKNEIQAQGLPLADFQIQNDARLDNVVYWARYLGLVRQMRDEPCAGLLPDPTLFVRRHIADVLPVGEEVTVDRCRKRLAALCPVLDGGVVRATLLSRIAPNWSDHNLSYSLSFAIARLEQNKELKAWCPDDQRDFLLMPGSSNRKVAYLKRTK